jgi:hypothetical protein
MRQYLLYAVGGYVELWVVLFFLGFSNGMAAPWPYYAIIGGFLLAPGGPSCSRSGGCHHSLRPTSFQWVVFPADWASPGFSCAYGFAASYRYRCQLQRSSSFGDPDARSSSMRTLPTP